MKNIKEKKCIMDDTLYTKTIIPELPNPGEIWHKNTANVDVRIVKVINIYPQLYVLGILCNRETATIIKLSDFIKQFNKNNANKKEEHQEYPQDSEENEYRYISNKWLDSIAYGLTKGAIKHPGETWREIPAKEHAARAIRHLNLYLMGNTEDNHLINASMRCMMAFETDKKEK